LLLFFSPSCNSGSNCASSVFHRHFLLFFSLFLPAFLPRDVNLAVVCLFLQGPDSPRLFLLNVSLVRKTSHLTDVLFPFMKVMASINPLFFCRYEADRFPGRGIVLWDFLLSALFPSLLRPIFFFSSSFFCVFSFSRSPGGMRPANHSAHPLQEPPVIPFFSCLFTLPALLLVLPHVNTILTVVRLALFRPEFSLFLSGQSCRKFIPPFSLFCSRFGFFLDSSPFYRIVEQDILSKDHFLPTPLVRRPPRPPANAGLPP